MSAAELRQAAALMRARAEAAASGSWVAEAGMVIKDLGRNPKYVAYCFNEPGGSVADAEHIASWHPAVALAVADWLDAEAAAADAIGEFNKQTANLVEEHKWTVRGAAMSVSMSDQGSLAISADTSRPALAVARAYLGSADD